jgi:sulfonate transport system substrate-binding protein
MTILARPSRFFNAISATLIIAAIALSGCLQSDATDLADGAPARITLDYAYYSPISLVLKHFEWLEEEFADDGTQIRWVHSLGSNRANEYSQSGTAHFASTAGVAALLARANGVPIRSVYIYSKPEWTALVTAADSEISTVSDLAGKRVAATRGTDPYFFLLQAIEQEGLSENDLEIVHLQHGDGKAALDRGDVDAWAGLDPYMAQGEVDGSSRLFFREPDFNTYGFLNALESFVERYPEATRRVVATYERGRQWIIDNPEEAAQILAEAARLDVAVARKVLIERNDFSGPIPGPEHRQLLEALAPILHRQGIVSERVDLQGAIDALLDPSYAEPVLATAGEGRSHD